MKEQMVYVMTADGTPGAVKVGCSQDPLLRAKQIRHDSKLLFPHAGPYRIVFNMRGGRVVEQAVHKMLAEHRASTNHLAEWFYVSKDEAIEAVLRAAWSERHTVDRGRTGGARIYSPVITPWPRKVKHSKTHSKIDDYYHETRQKYKDIAFKAGVTAGYLQALKRNGGLIGECPDTGELTLYRPVKKRVGADHV